MRAYRRFRKRSAFKYVVYLTEVEHADLIAEGQGADPDYTPAWCNFLRRLENPREDGKCSE
ncbi:hypothetical protein [Streptomyces sp. NPDC086782]|uniref:hypothetical protein n=1 Tax=Streptomyces sp. NPDC086782 TaxID=3365757 RepID=UPI00380191F5